MSDDEISEDEARGAMLHRGLVEQRQYQIDNAQRETDAMRAEIERLTRERDEAQCDFVSICEKGALAEISLKARAEAAEREVKTLREALQPFAELRVGRFMTNGIAYSWRIDVARIREARAALAETEKGNE